MNQNINAGNAALTAYHFASGSSSQNIVLDLSVTGQYTTMIGTQGSSFGSTLVIGSQSSTTAFEFRSNLGLPANLTSGTLLFQITSGGQLYAPLLANQSTTNSVAYNSSTGQLSYASGPMYTVVTTQLNTVISNPMTYYILKGVVGSLYVLLPPTVTLVSGMWVGLTNTNASLAYVIQSDGSNMFTSSGITFNVTLAPSSSVRMIYDGTLWYQGI